MTKEQIEALTIAEVESILRQRPKVGPKLCRLLETDSRSGVRRLAVQARKQRRQQQAERARLRHIMEHEQRWWQSGLTRVAGVDEVGRGCLAGPVVAAAVILPPEIALTEFGIADSWIERVDDSKKLDQALRESLSTRIKQHASGIALAVVDAERIDEINILEASMEAMRQALADLDPPPQQALVDGNRKPGSRFAEMTIVGGDARSISIAAASIVAKVHRDRLMARYHDSYPVYGFCSNKGYASSQHLKALDEFGPCPLHRRSFRPIAPKDPHKNLTSPKETGQLHLALGAKGETLAAGYLKAQGYQILERGYRAAGAEIDLVAERGGCITFVEVKSSQSSNMEYRPEERVVSRKRSHLIRASRVYLRDRERRDRRTTAYRFDVIAVCFQKEGAQPQIHHLEGAFEAPPF